MISIKNGKLRFKGEEPLLKSELCGLILGMARVLDVDAAELGTELINVILRNTKSSDC